MVEKLRLYLETSFWRRLVDEADHRRRRSSWKFLRAVERRHAILVSDLVFAEAKLERDPQRRDRARTRLNRTRKHVLRLRSSVTDLAEQLLDEGHWSDRRLADLTHLALAILGRADAVVTWNLRDLARPRMREVLRAVCSRRGYNQPKVGTPQEVSQWFGISAM